MKFNPYQNNAFQSIKQLLIVANVNFTETYLRNLLIQHSGFPNLTSLNDTLRTYNIETLVMRLNPEDLFTIPIPAIFHLKDGRFCTVKDIDSKSVCQYNDKIGWEFINFNTFISNWDGVVLLVETSKVSGEKNFYDNQKSERKKKVFVPFLIFLATSLITFCCVYFESFINGINKFNILFLFLKTLGGIVFSLLLSNRIKEVDNYRRKEFGIYIENSQNDLIRHIFYPYIALADIGLLYSVAGFLSVLIFPLTIFVFYFISCFVLLITLSSFVYSFQNIEKKQFWILFFVALFDLVIYFQCSPKTIKDDSYSLILPMLIVCLLIFIMWYIIVPLIEKSTSLEKVYLDIQKIKFNNSKTLLLRESSTFLPPIFTGMNIVENNNNMIIDIIVVLNPTCQYSRSLYNEIRYFELYKKANIKYIFITSTANKNNQVFINTVLNLPKELRLEASNVWFKEVFPNPAEWLKTISISDTEISKTTQSDIHLKWVQLANIHSVPAVFIDNLEYPPLFIIEDIDKVLDNLLKV